MEHVDAGFNIMLATDSYKVSYVIVVLCGEGRKGGREAAENG